MLSQPSRSKLPGSLASFRQPQAGRLREDSGRELQGLQSGSGECSWAARQRAGSGLRQGLAGLGVRLGMRRVMAWEFK